MTDQSATSAANMDAETKPESRPARGWRAQLDRVISSPFCERFIVGVIVFNAITLGLETSPTVMSLFGETILFLDKVVLAIFAVEIALRMIAKGWAFWRDPWSLFDFTIVAISLIPQSGNLSILRALRIVRALRLISMVPSMRRVVNSLLKALPSMGSIIILLVLINYVFAVMATKLFGKTFPEFFGTIGASLFTLFQIMTLEGWAMNVVRPVMAEHPLAWTLFLPYIIIVVFAVLNLFIGIVVDAMQQTAKEQSEAVIEVTKTEYHALMSEISSLRHEIRDLAPNAGDRSPRDAL
ncbi:MAG: ion transporter [Pseudomonadota bacterium]